MPDQRPVEERFWEKVKKTEKCWNWTAGKVPDGYGKFTVNGRLKLAHRVSYEMEFGAIPSGLTLDHLCRNRACVNPKHLEPVSNKENVLRGFSYSAVNARKESCPKGHPYDHEGPNGGTKRSRRCNTCSKEAAKRMRDSYREQPRRPSPTKERLQQLIEGGASWVDIGRRYGVSDVTAKNWAKKHELIGRGG